jgi:large subunit ribosomal protein L4
MGLTVEIRDVEGSTTGAVTLDEALFGIQPNIPVLHQVVTAQLAAARTGTQSTKTRAEVSGGGRKPFKQKGTGRARQGSERAPHFTGGGVALGPKPRDHRQRTPRKMIQLALRSALSDRASEDKVVVVGAWPWDVPSTKNARAALDALELFGRVLVVLDRTQEDVYKSFRNLPGVQLLLSEELNAYDILCNDWIVFTPETLPGQSSSTPTAVTTPVEESDEGSAAGSPVVASEVGTDADEVATDAGTDTPNADDAPAHSAPSAEAGVATDDAVATDDTVATDNAAATDDAAATDEEEESSDV